MTRIERARLAVAGAVVAFSALVAISSLAIDATTPAAGHVALPPVDPAVARRVYVLAWGYHSSIFVEQPAGWRLGPEGNESAPFVEYGWGDRGFFMESNFNPASLFAAACLPTASVIYVRGHDQPPDEVVVGGEVYARSCSADEIARLVGVLEAQMVRGPIGERPAALAPTPEYVGRFYPGREYYVVWTNCNEWTVRMLALAGMSASSRYVWFKHDVAPRLRGFRLVEDRIQPRTAAVATGATRSARAS